MKPDSPLRRASTFLFSSGLAAALVASGAVGSLPESLQAQTTSVASAVEEQRELVANMVGIAEELARSVQGRTMTDALYGFSQSERLLLPGGDPARQAWSYWPRPRAGLHPSTSRGPGASRATTSR